MEYQNDVFKDDESLCPLNGFQPCRSNCMFSVYSRIHVQRYPSFESEPENKNVLMHACALSQIAVALLQAPETSGVGSKIRFIQQEVDEDGLEDN